MAPRLVRPGQLGGVLQVGGKQPFDKLRANGQAFSFALSLSKGKFAPEPKYAQLGRY
jgi:hypothetical protein